MHRLTARVRGARPTSGAIEVGFGDYVFEHDPACAGGENEAFNELFNRFVAAGVAQTGLGEWAGPIGEGLSSFSSGVRDFIAGQGGDLAKMASSYTQPRANCKIVAAKLPAGATNWAFKLFWRESGGGWAKQGRKDQVGSGRSSKLRT